MITDYVPAAYVTHDMLHMRGGHQVDWLIDGVPIPNTNIATIGARDSPEGHRLSESKEAATRLTMATERTAYSISCREPVLNAIRNATSPPALEISIKPTTRSVAAGTRSDLLTMSA